MLLITKFNRMIRNKLMWAVFAGIVTVSFVATGIINKSSGTPDQDDKRGKEGRICGEEISSTAFYTAKFFQMDMRDASSLTPKQNRMLRQLTWERIAVLKKAEELGVTVSDEELREVIRREPGFSINGVFNPDRYRAFAASQLRTDPEEATQIYERYLRERMTINKLFATMRSAIWTAPEEVQSRLSDLVDSFTVEYSKISREIDEDKVTPDEEHIKNFYEENIEIFRIPNKVAVRYVEFPVENYIEKVDIPETDINEFYNQHSEEYSVTDTNGASIPIPLDEARDDIKERIYYSKALRSAVRAADQLISRLQPSKSGEAAGFNESAAASSISVCTSDFFTVTGPVPDLEKADADFCRIAFSLDKNNPDRYFSDPLIVSNSVFVLAAEAVQESYLPELNDVKKTAAEYAKAELINEKRLAEAESTHKQIAKLIKEGKSFTESVISLGFNVSTTAPFNVYEGITTNSFEHSDVIIRAVVSMEKGDLSEPLNTYDGTLVAFVTDREAGDALMMQSLRPQFLYTVEGYRLSNIYDDWAEKILESAELEDYHPIKLDLDEEKERDEDQQL